MLESLRAQLELFHLQQPIWLLLIAVPFLLSRFVRKNKSASRLERFIERPLWKYLLSGFNTPQKHNGLFITAWILACIALAAPTLQKSETSQQQKALTNIVIVLDISPSMRVQDVSPSRLEYSKRLLNELLTKLDHHRIGLIAFSANAYVVSPLTSDKNIIRQQLDAMDPSLASISGSNLARALELATKILESDAPGHMNAPGGIALLVSDGEIHDTFAMQASRFLGQSGHKLLTLGVGTEQGGPVPFSTGRLVSENAQLVVSQRKQENLRLLADTGHGYYQDLHPDAWNKILASSNALKQVQEEVINQSNATPIFAWLLIPALVLFVWQGLRKSSLLTIALALPLAVVAPPADATTPISLFTQSNAEKYLASGNNAKALELYSRLDNYAGKMGEGAAAYKLENWTTAHNAYKQALERASDDLEKSRASYNLGNTLIQLGQLKSAANAYQQAIVWQPGYAKANRNLTLLKQHQQGKGGEKEGDSEFERKGFGSKDDDESKNSGQSKHARTHQDMSDKDGQQGQQHKRHSAELKQSLSQWQHSSESGEQPPPQSLQQTGNVKEDYKSLLKQRFESEDTQANALAQEKPW